MAEPINLKQTPMINETRKILPFIFLILIIFGWAHYFIFQISTRSIIQTDLKYIYALILFVGLVLMPTGFFASHVKKINLSLFVWLGYIWMGFFNFLFFFSLLELGISNLLNHTYSFWVIPASLIVTIWSLVQGLKDPSLILHKLKNKKLASLRLVQISDLHVGMLHLNESWLSRVINKINQTNPHIIVITGDLVEGEFNTNNVKLDVLKNLNPLAKKYYITGNHEYLHGAGPWENKLQELGFTILHNQNEIVDFQNAKIMMAGVPDRMISRFLKNKKSLPDVALKYNFDKNPQTDYKILLTHQPSSVFDLKNETCDLILSGHTHGGQIFPFHLAVRLFHPVLAGFKNINNILVFAHQGTGLWGPPMRWFSRSEIVLLEWEK